jgi:hypothetical protein
MISTGKLFKKCTSQYRDEKPPVEFWANRCLFQGKFWNFCNYLIDGHIRNCRNELMEFLLDHWVVDCFFSDMNSTWISRRTVWLTSVESTIASDAELKISLL